MWNILYDFFLAHLETCRNLLCFFPHLHKIARLLFFFKSHVSLKIIISLATRYLYHNSPLRVVVHSLHNPVEPFRM